MLHYLISIMKLKWNQSTKTKCIAFIALAKILAFIILSGFYEQLPNY